MTDSSTSSRRRFGAGSLFVAVVATAVVAAGGTYFFAHGHDASPQAGAADAAKEQWQCPMHPTIVQDHPGDCPICGMKLVKVESAGAAAGGAKSGASAPAQEQWQCPMHPSIVQDHPGDCPICGMKLVKVASSGGGQTTAGEPSPDGLVPITIDAARQQLIGLSIAHVARGPVGGSWRTNGRVAVDETRVHHVNVKFSGFMERVHANFVGRPVKKGEPLFSIYSPELLAAQEEYLLAVRTRGTLARQGGLASDGDDLVQAARRKLQLWDVPRSELDRIQRTGEASREITFYSPVTGVVTRKDVVDGMRVNAGDMPFEIVDLSRVWVLADAYETDLRKVKVGMPATLSLKAFPNRAFEGRVAFVDPLLDPKSRTAKVRVEVPNPAGDLKPDMFGEVVFRGNAREGLRVTPDAVIESGTQTVVFVALGEGRFQPREVELGERGTDYVEVISGLEQGDGVVTRANFLVDSESRLRASLAALTSGGAGGAGGDHAGHAAPATEPGASAPTPREAPASNPHAGHGR